MSFHRGSEEQVACFGKKAFPTYWSANRAAKNLNRYSDHAKSNPYQCAICRLFHVGNTMGKKRMKHISRHTMKEELRFGRVTFSE